MVEEGILREQMWNALLLFKKCPSIFLEKYFYSKSPFKKGHFNKGILSRNIEGHFLKAKRTFPPNRQKPNFERMFTPQHMSHGMCHKSCVTFHLSHVFSYLDMLSTWPTPSTFLELDIHDCESNAMKLRANGSFPCKGDMSHV